MRSSARTGETRRPLSWAAWLRDTWLKPVFAEAKIVNGIVRKHLGARKISFAPMASAVSLTGMEYGGITPLGLPAVWPILVDLNVIDQERVIIGSGIRGSKLLAATEVLTSLSNAEVLAITKPIA